jgi:hypothetical protein
MALLREFQEYIDLERKKKTLKTLASSFVNSSCQERTLEENTWTGLTFNNWTIKLLGYFLWQVYLKILIIRSTTKE